MFHIFLILKQRLYTYLYFCFLLFSLSGPPGRLSAKCSHCSAGPLILLTVIRSSSLAAIYLFNVAFESLYQCNNAKFNASQTPYPFFSWNVQSTSSLGCEALCILMSCLVLWSICISSYLVMNGPEYLTSETALGLISLLRFLLDNLFSNSFLVLLRYTFLYFFCHLQFFDDICFQYSKVFVDVFPSSILFFFFFPKIRMFIFWKN